MMDEVTARALVAELAQSPEALQKLDKLAELLTAENRQQNLVAAATLPHVWERHFADSAQLLRHVPRGTSGTWLDLGTGAGFPGLVIAILRPDIRVIMVESRTRRVAWLRDACAELGLTNGDVCGARVEAVETFSADVISARAFAPLDRLMELSARFSTSNTIWVLPKGRSAADEVQKLSGWNHTFHVEQSRTDPEAGIIVGTVDGKLAGKKARAL